MSRMRLLKSAMWITLLSLPFPVMAEDWVLVSSVETETAPAVVLVDREEIDRGGIEVTLRTMTLYKGSPIQVRTSVVIDCAAQTVTIANPEIKDFDGNLLEVISGRKRELIPESGPGVNLYAIACVNEWPEDAYSYGESPVSRIYQERYGE